MVTRERHAASEPSASWFVPVKSMSSSFEQVQVVSCARFQSIELPVVLNILSLVEHLEADLSVACLMLGGVGHS